VLGVSPADAEVATKTDLPPYPDLPIDFGFRHGANRANGVQHHR
jgi:hypothetical protein